MKLTLSLAATAMVMTLSAQPAWASLTVYIPLGSANKVIAVDAASNRITATYGGVDNPHGLVATPDGEYLVAGSLSETPLPQGAAIDTPNSKLVVIHPAHGHVMSTIPVAGWTHHQAITPDGRYVLSTHPTRGGISVDGRWLFVSLISEDKLVALDPQTDERRVLPLAPAPYHLGAVRGTGKLYVSSRKEAKIWVVDQTSLKLPDTIQLPGGEGHQLAIVP